MWRLSYSKYGIGQPDQFVGRADGLIRASCEPIAVSAAIDSDADADYENNQMKKQIQINI